MSSITLQDVSLYIQTFQVLYPRLSCLFCKKGKRLRNSSFFFVNYLVDSNLFFFNLQKIPASSRLFLFSLRPSNTIVFNVLMLQLCRRKQVKNKNEVVMILNLITKEDLQEFRTELLEDLQNLFQIKIYIQKPVILLSW